MNVAMMKHEAVIISYECRYLKMLIQYWCTSVGREENGGWICDFEVKGRVPTSKYRSERD